MRPWSCSLAKPCDKQKPLYLYYQSAYGNQLWRIVAYFHGLLPIKSIDPFDQVILRDQVTSYNHYISIITLPMVTELGRIVV